MRRYLVAVAFGLALALGAFATTISSGTSGGGGSSTTSVTGDPMASYTLVTASTGTACGGVATRIDFNQVLYGDTDSAVTTGASWAFTVPASKGGVYSVCVSVVGSPTSGSPLPKLTLFLNGSAALPIVEMPNGSGEVVLHGCVFVEAVPTNTIDVRCSSGSGTWTETVNAGSWINIYRVRTAI